MQAQAASAAPAFCCQHSYSYRVRVDYNVSVFYYGALVPLNVYTFPNPLHLIALPSTCSRHTEYQPRYSMFVGPSQNHPDSQRLKRQRSYADSWSLWLPSNNSLRHPLQSGVKKVISISFDVTPKPCVVFMRALTPTRTSECGSRSKILSPSR